MGFGQKEFGASDIQAASGLLFCCVAAPNAGVDS